ncbi:M48 family metallopeptidase [Helicobacter cappadocius]|uniref:SprT family zinc-dependent metalloprotease n=1 Tax=Helicobacter cappadocius TaxID=3063998 RepID=A0AA90T5Q2_9HELI|nr:MULTISPECIES: SprT family zinc-dependent metalloprotease [unclassified Helicobacter]MDO7253819.1 SprT family zinc-dependent metalloprotease [Helicobacter sp. faydin-H75]MDP2539708.1 SprT family zinc-dependent metalloprotease [Helicobacter sp. faydin-H76]
MDTKHQITIKKTFAKNARITLKPSGEIYVSVPFFYTQKNISQLLCNHQSWIEKHLQKITQNYRDIENILDEHKNEVLIFGVWEKIDKKPIKIHLKKILSEYLNSTVRDKANQMRVEYNKINIRENKSRLGSCSYQNNLSFSLVLVCAPKELIDYVIIHELAHIRYKDHSKNFWDYVGVYCLNWKKKRATLKKNTKLYLSLLDSLE